MPDDDDDADDLHGTLVQPVAHSIVNGEVAGSIPVRSATRGGSSDG